MGRNRKGKDLQIGNLTQEQQQDKEIQENAVKLNSDQLEKPPRWLVDNIAKKEWKRLVEQFKTISIISNLDLNNLGAYCNAYSFYIKATNALKEEELNVKYTNKANATNLIENPLIKIQIKYSEEMRKYAALLGLSIDSRLKLADLKVKETKNEIGNEFGDI